MLVKPSFFSLFGVSRERVMRPGYSAQNYARLEVLFNTYLSNYYLAIILKLETVIGSDGLCS